MDNNNSFMLNIIAKLNKRLSKNSIKNDLKSLDNTMSVKILAKLSKTLASRELKKQLKELNDLYVNVGTKAKIDKSTKTQIQQNIKTLQQTISDLEIGIKASKINNDIENVRNKVQKKVQNTPISFNLEIQKNKLLSDIEYLGKRYSKLFSNVSASNKYENILNHAYNVSNRQQLTDTKAELAAFTSELKANGLAAQSAGAKWGKLIDRAKELFSAAAIVRTIFTQVKQSVATFLELDTAMTNLYKVQEDILSRDQFSGLLTKWNKLAQNLAVTTKSLIDSAAAWSKMGFDLDMSEQLAQITAIFEKTAEITNEKASSTLISAAQAFTEIDDLGVDDYVKRVEAVGNKINAIGNRYAITSEGIADGLQNASAALKMAGNDLNETIALITATNKIYQSPEEGSNMLKVASMRLRGQVDALKELGEDAEGVSTDLTKIQQQIYELTGNKVNIFADDENLKSTYQMILEIGEVFDSLSDRKQAELLEIMFGKQRASAGASLLLNYQELEKIKNDSINAANSMAEEYSKYMESAEAHITVFKEKLTETYSVFMSGDVIRYTADVGSALLDLVNSTDLLKHSLIAITTLKVGQGISSFGAVIASTVTQMNSLGNAIQQLKSLPLDKVLRRNVLDELGETTKSLTEKNLKLLLSQKQLSESDRILILRKHDLTETEAKAKLEKMGLTKATQAQSVANVEEAATTNTLKGAFTGLATSIKATWSAMSMLQKASIIFAAVSTAWSVFSMMVDKHNQKLEEARQKNIEAGESAKEHANSLKDLYNEYKRLSSIQNRTTSEEQDFKTAVENITKALSDKASVLEGLTAGTNEYAEALERVTREELQSASVDATIGRKSAQEELQNNIWSEWSGSQVSINSNSKGKALSAETQKAVDIVSDSLKEFETINRTWKNISWDISSDDPEEALKYFNALVKAREELVLSSESDEALLDTEIYSDLNTAIHTMTESLDTYIEQRYEEEKLVYMAQNSIPSTTEEYKAMEQAMISVAEESVDLQNKFKELLSADFSSLAVDIENIGDAQNKLQNSIRQITDDHGISDREEYSDLTEYTKDFTQAQIELWLEATQGAENATDAINKYEESLKSVDETPNEPLKLFDQLATSEESLDKFQSSVKSAYDAYSTLMSGNYSSSELLDSIQEISKVASEMGGTLNWEFIDSKTNSLKFLGDAIERISEKYAESVLSGAGIDVSSEFGQMLANNIIQAQKAEAEFEAMNTQLDNLQSSYQTLTDIIDSYNETGYISLDNLQSLLTADENLIQMLEVENGQLVLNQQAYENLVAVQLLEFKTKLNDAAAAEIETLAKQKAEQATNSNAQASENAVAKLDAETAAFGRNTSAAIANAVAKAEEAGVSESEIQGVLDKYTEIWNSALNNYNVDFDSFMGGGKKAAGKAGKDAGKEYANKFEDALNNLKSALSGITSLIDKQINAYSESKDAAVSSLKEELNARVSVIEAQKEQLNNQIKLIDAQIKAKQKIIDGVRAEIQAMKDANDQRQRELALQDALFRQKQAENQRSKLVYNSEKGFTYETDTDAIRSAKEDVDQAKFDIAVAEKEKQISLVEHEIDLLESKKDLLSEQIDLLDAQISQITDYYDKLITETENYWDSLIESMQNYKDRWTELSEIEDQAKLISQLKELGITTEDITNMSADAFEKFKDRYLAALLKVNEGNADVQNSIAELGGSAGSIQPVSDAIDNASSSMDNLSGSASTAGQSVSNTASNLNDASTSAGQLSDSLTKVNTAISEEQTAFDNLKQTIDEVIEAINDKIIAIQEEQRTVGIATSSEMADFLLLRDKILEVKESVAELGDTVTDLDSQTLDNLTNSFQGLYDKIILVSDALGSGIDGEGEGVTNSIASAIQALNDISLEEGIIAQFNNLKTVIDEVTTAISGGGGESSSSQSQGGQSGASGESDGVNSLSSAITSMGETANEVIGEPEAEGDGTVIGEFGSFKTAVNDVTEAIGIGGEEGQSEDANLIGSINDLGTTTEETLGESGGDGAIGRFEEFKDVIGEANEHVTGISEGLAAIDGQEVECTIKVNIETTGGIGGLGFVNGSMNLDSAEYNAKLGAAHVEGTALASGNWAVQSDEKSALMGEIGYEIIVRNGRFFTVGENGAEMVPIKKGDIVFNHKQSEELLKNGHISGRGKAYADGTVGDKLASGVLRPLQPGDRMWELQQKVNNYLAQAGEDVHSLLSPINTIQRDMEQMAQSISTVNNVNNTNNKTQQIVQQISLNLPNVTNNSGIEYIQKELGHLALRADQESMKH